MEMSNSNWHIPGMEGLCSSEEESGLQYPEENGIQAETEVARQVWGRLDQNLLQEQLDTHTHKRKKALTRANIILEV